MLTAEIELKLQELTAVDYDRRNWSWLLDPNRTLVPSVLSREPASTKGSPAVVIKRPRISGRVLSVKRKRAPAQHSRTLLPEEVAPEYVSFSSVIQLFNACFLLQKRSRIGFDESD